MSQRFLRGIEIALVIAALGLLICHVTGLCAIAKPSEAKAEITGPARIEYAGQLALFRASVPGKSPKELIYTWGVEPLAACPDPGDRLEAYPTLVATPNAGETQLTTVSGRWRLWCAITDPSIKSGQMLSRLVEVPGSIKPIPPKPVPPEPNPSPPPAPLPGPDPAPRPQPPAPANRFSDLTTSAREWLADVSSPAKSTEAAALRSGAMAIIARLTDGDLSKSTGMSLELSVVRAIQTSNSEAIKANASAWKGFAGKVGTYAGTALSAKKLTNPAEWAELLRAFADGLG